MRAAVRAACDIGKLLRAFDVVNMEVSIAPHHPLKAANIFPNYGIVMDRLNSMATLLAVVDTGSFSGASRKLRVPLTTVSRRIADLETHLRTKLLHRTTRRVTLTDAGAPYVSVCRQVINQVEDAERVASGEYQTPRGELTVTAPLILGRLHLVPVAAEFMAKFPQIQLSFRFFDRVVDLQQEDIDVAIRIGHLADSAQRARRIGNVRLILCASPGYLATCGEPRRLAELAEHDCVVFHGASQYDAWVFATENGSVTIPIRSRISFNTMESVIDAGIAGLGLVRVFSYQVRSALQAGTLRSVLPDHAPPSLPVHALHPGGGLLPLKVRAFIDFCAPRLQARLAF